MSKKNFYQSSSKKAKGKNMNMVTRGFTFYTNVKGTVTSYKYFPNTKTKEGRASYVIGIALILLTGYTLNYILIVFHYLF